MRSIRRSAAVVSLACVLGIAGAGASHAAMESRSGVQYCGIYNVKLTTASAGQLVHNYLDVNTGELRKFSWVVAGTYTSYGPQSASWSAVANAISSHTTSCG